MTLNMLRSGARLARIAANTARWQSTATGKPRASRSWRLRGTYIFPILLFSAVSSLAINVRNAKDDARLLEDKHAAQLSVLRDLLARLLAGENLSQQQLVKEYERVGIIKRQDVTESKPSKTITWRETLFGRKKEERDLEAERQELADIEHSKLLLCTRFRRVVDSETSIVQYSTKPRRRHPLR